VLAVLIRGPKLHPLAGGVSVFGLFVLVVPHSRVFGGHEAK